MLATQTISHTEMFLLRSPCARVAMLGRERSFSPMIRTKIGKLAPPPSPSSRFRGDDEPGRARTASHMNFVKVANFQAEGRDSREIVNFVNSPRYAVVTTA